MVKYFIYIICFVFFSLCNISGLLSQDFKEGYAFLENEAYEEAISYFSKQLVKSPQNKTANICYGRAIGLSGKKEKALAFFQKIEKDFPHDTEILLNKAEAFLWNQDFNQAINTYENILSQDSLNFTANVGLANTYSALHDYHIANRYLQKSIQIDPSQGILKQVKKYIYLGLAAQEKENLQTIKAHEYLDSIMTLFPGDKDIILERAFVFLYEEKNKKAYQTFLRLVDKNPFEAYLGLSHCSILLHQANNSLSFADSALIYRPIDSLQRGFRAEIAKIYALGFNEKFISAHTLVDRLLDDHPDNHSLKIAKSRLYTWNEQFAKSENRLDSMNIRNFDLFLAKADLYRGMELYNKALSTIDTALSIQPLQIDATRLQKLLQSEVSPLIHILYGNLTDIAQNHAKDYFAGIKIRSNDRHHYSLSLQSRQTNDPIFGAANQRIARFSDDIRMNNNWRINFGIAAVQSSSEAVTFTKAIYDAKVKVKLTKDQYLSAGSEVVPHNYNSALILSEILMNNYYLAYSFNTKDYPGIYISFTRTNQSDNNNKNLLYLSLYKAFQRNSTFKMGVNYTYFGFSRNSNIYFSPSDFYGLEGFVEYHNHFAKGQQFFYSILLAPGFQKIENNNNQNTLRANIQLDYVMNNHITLYGGYQYSNAAATTTAGYTSNYFFGGLKYSL